jgi:aconitate hydratase
VKTELSVQYVDHNLLQEDHKNPDDHLFLHSASRRFGLWFSRPGNGVSHPLHMEYFGRPGATLLGSDSHTCAGGALGMLAIGAGGLDVAMAMAGEPLHLPVPEIWGVRLEGALPEWVSAKDVILEMLRRHGVEGGVGRIIEYHGPGVEQLDVWDRHVIANMGAELGATATVFPSDERTREFLKEAGREDAFVPLSADDGAGYDHHDVIDLGALQPLIAKPSSPGNVVAVEDVVGEPIYQAYVGSSANPGFRDYAVVAAMVEGKRVPPHVSLDINPSTRTVLTELTASGALSALLEAGARLHQAGCNGCIGMGQAPATGKNSLRTVPRNFPGRSGTREDRIWLCSPETAAASVLAGEIRDPRSISEHAPRVPHTPRMAQSRKSFLSPPDDTAGKQLIKGPNIRSLPELDSIGDDVELPVLLRLGDDVSTDEILPAGARVLPFRSNVEAISDFCFEAFDEDYVQRARERGDHAVIAGRNYGQGSSREHAALAPRFLGLRVVLAESFARIHRQNLIAFGVLPLRLVDPTALDGVGSEATLCIRGIHAALAGEREAPDVQLDGRALQVAGDGLSPREGEVIRAGGLLAHHRARSA